MSEHQAQLVTQRQESPMELRDNVLSVIARAATDPTVDVGKMERLLDMQLKVLALANEASFNQALARLQPRLPRIEKKGMIGRGTDRQIPYVRYEDICDVILPLLYQEGFTVSYSQRLMPSGNLMEIVATFRHIDGHKAEGSAFMPLTDDSGGKNRAQGGASVYSYGQRIAFSKFLNIVAEGEDDDGMQGAAKPIDEKQVGQLIDLIADAKADEGKFLAFMGAEKLQDIRVGDFPKAIKALNQKRSGKKS